MIPFGRCVYLWRLKRGLSQAALARKAGIARPNLSDIERGEREVSLRTLRSLALALEINPGTLADGLGPEPAEHETLSREKMERIAKAVAEGKTLSDRKEKALVKSLTLLTVDRLKSQGGHSTKNIFPQLKHMGTGRKAGQAWLSLAQSYSEAEIQSLIGRISEKSLALRSPGPGSSTGDKS